MKKKIFEMLKLFFITYFTLLFTVCNGEASQSGKIDGVQKGKVSVTPTEKLNIQEFDKHQVDGEWTYIDNNGNNIHVTKDIGEYWEEITNENTVFTKRRNYYLNGNIKLDSQYFHDSGFAKGIWTYYDKEGKVIKTEDNDLPFKNFPWEKVREYLLSNGVNLKDNFTMVHNEHSRGAAYWLLSWDTKKVNAEGSKVIYNVQLDGETGKPSNKKTTYFNNN